MSSNDVAEWPGAWNVVKQAFKGVQANPNFAILYVVLNLISSALARHDNDAVKPALGIGLLVVIVCSVAMIRYELKIARNESANSLKELFVAPIGLYVLTLLSFIILSIAFCLAAIPILIPLIWVIPWLSFTLYFVIEQGLSPFAAMGASKQAAQDHKGKIWGLIGIAFLLSFVGGLLGAIPAVGWIISSIVTALVSLVIGVGITMLYARLVPKTGDATLVSEPAPVV